MGVMAASNYPPGVTGREPQIAGCDEVTLSVTCGEQIDTVLSSAAHALVIGVRRENGTVAHVEERLQHLPTITTACPFDGDVVAEAHGDVAYWTCPLCDNEHEVEL